MAVKCILTGQTPSALDGVTENVQTQIDNKVDKVTGKGLSTEDYTTVEKTKLSGIEEGAQKNTVTSVAGKTGAVTLAASDVGAQPKITITGILQGDGNGNITAVESIGAEIVTLDKADVGLGNVDNTSDANKPISTATQTALDAKQNKLSDDVAIDSEQVGLRNAHGYYPTSFLSIKGGENSFLSATYAAADDIYYGFSAPLAENPGDGQKPNEIYLAKAPYAGGDYSVDFTTPVALKNVADPTDQTDAMNLRSTEQVVADKVAVKGILRGDGAGHVTAAEEAEVELVELTADSIGAASKSRILNITLPAASWTGSGPYTQTVTISGGTANTKVDIQVDDNAIQQMIDDDVSALYISNTYVIFTVHAVVEKPSVDLTIQISCSEVNIIQV